MNQLRNSGKQWTTEDLLTLDRNGIKINKQKIYGLIADVGDSAIKTGEAMHYTGKLGAVNEAKKLMDKYAKLLGLKTRSNGGYIEEDEQALINEDGRPEIIARDGKMILTEKGAHLENLKAGDIVFDADQSEELLEGKVKSNDGKGTVIGNSYAHGTVTDGMPAHASMSGNFTMSPTYPDLVWHTQEVDDALDDFNDGLNDAGDGLGDAGDALDDAIDDAINHSKQLFDYVEIRLNYLDRVTNKFVSRFNDWMTSLEKRENLESQITATLNQIQGNSTGAMTYAERAEHDAYDYTYWATDKNAIQSI